MLRMFNSYENFRLIQYLHAEILDTIVFDFYRDIFPLLFKCVLIDFGFMQSGFHVYR